MRSKTALLFLALLVHHFVVGAAHANHGPGTTGGGAQAVSGETLKPGQIVFSLDHTYTNYEDVSRDEAERRAAKSGEFDAIRDAYVTSLTMAYGAVEDFQLEAQIGWYSGTGFIDAHAGEDDGRMEHQLLPKHSIEAESSTGSPQGLTDLVLRAKYRLFHGPEGHFSALVGTVIPTGKDDERLSDGDQLEPSSQPGTGEFGLLGGVAYSRYLTARLTMDTSSVYTHRFEHDDFRVGSRVDTSSGMAYRLTDMIEPGPQFSLFTEVNYTWLGRDREGYESNPNSGGNIVYLTPGVRVRIPGTGTMALSTSVPVVQDLNGDQAETDYRILAQLAVFL